MGRSRLVFMWLALLVSALSVACHSLAFAIAPESSPADVIEIRKAADPWNGIVKPDRRVRFDGSDWTVIRSAPPGGVNGDTLRHERVIMIKPGIDAPSVFATALHELGHAIGLDHTCRPTQPNFYGTVAPGAPDCIPGQSFGVMDPTTVSALPFTASDKAECRRVGACGSSP